MRGDDLVVFGTAVLVSAGVIAAAWYFDSRKEATPPPAEVRPPVEHPAAAPAPTPQSASSAPSERAAAAGAGGLRRCIGPNDEIVITDQPSCDNLDLKPGLSVIDAPARRPLPQRADARGETATTPRAQRMPRQRDWGKPPPRGLTVECRWLVGRAGEIERLLGEAEDPAESIWRSEYCKILDQVGEAECRVPGDQFYFWSLCP